MNEMANMPLETKIGFAAALLGGVIAIALMAAAWDSSADSLPMVGLNMLLAVMFFATAGTFTKYSPVPSDTALVLSILCLIVAAVGGFLESGTLWILAVEFIIAIFCVLVAMCPKFASWTDSNRAI